MSHVSVLRKAELAQAERLKSAAVADSFAPFVPKLRRMLTWQRPTAPGRQLTYGNTFGAWIDGRLAGVSRYVVEIGGVSDIWVSASYRRSGIGKGLLRAAERQLQRHGVKIARLHTPRFNAGAVTFYIRQGWRIERIKHHHQLHCALVQFVKRLNG